MKNKNTCVTKFIITGDFDVDFITKTLKLLPNKKWNKGDFRRDGSKYTQSLWETSICNDYNAFITNQMEKTIEILTDKVELLNELRKKFNLSYTLCIVPHLYVGEITPCLDPSLKIIDFCHLTRTEICYDLYLYE